MNGKNVFCKGILCRKKDRKHKCIKCHKWVCRICSTTYKNKTYCIDCYLDFCIDKDFKEEYNKIIDSFKVKI